MNRDSLEVEVKFHVADLNLFRQRLVEAGATLHKPRAYEQNLVFDTADHYLRRRLQLLRLRQDTHATLTLKSPAPADRDSEAKVRHELEIEVSDFDIAAAIFEALGFLPQIIYEKYRETFHLGSLEVVLDELPFGNFVELEGDENAIQEASAMLGLSWAERILANYLTLFATVRVRYGLPFKDITFDNFAGLETPRGQWLSGS